MDFTITNHGSIVIIEPLTEAAIDWVAEHIPEDAQRWGRAGVVVEPRYVGDIVAGIEADGLEIGG